MRGRVGRQRRQGFALGYLLSIVLVAVVIVLLAALLVRLIWQQYAIPLNNPMAGRMFRSNCSGQL